MLFTPLACLITCGTLLANTSEDEKKYLDYMRTAYRANRELFTFGTIDFAYSSGKAQNADDARAARLSNSMTAHGLYAFDGKNTRYERIYDEQDLIKNTTRNGDQLRTPANSFRALADGQSCLLDHISSTASLDGVIHTVEIYPDAKLLYRDFLFPIDLWHPNPVGFDLASDIDAIQKGVFTMEGLDPKASFEGHEVVHLSFRTENIRRSYWIDLKRGAVPLQIRHEVEEAHRVFQVNHDDLRPANGSGWLPRKVTMYLESNKLARQVVIREMKLDTPPDPSTFRIEFPKPIPMIDGAKKLIYDPRASWSLISLPSANSSQAKKLGVAEHQQPAPEMPGERPNWPSWSVILISLGVVLFIIMLIQVTIAIKRRR